MFRVQYWLAGACIGVANLIPGISGASIAIFFGLYSKLLNSFSQSLTKPISIPKHISLWLPIGLGAILGILSFSHLIDWALNKHLNSLKIMLLLCMSTQIPHLFKKHPYKLKKQDAVLIIALTLLFTCLLLFFGKANPLQANTPTTLGLFLSGILAAAAMVLPGLSGSLMLVLIGTYGPIIQAIKQVNIEIIFTVGIGAVIGVLGISWLLSKLLKTFPKTSFLFIISLIIASFVPLWPKNTLLSVNGLAIASCITGLSLSMFVKTK